MRPSDDRGGEHTFETVRSRYEDYAENRPAHEYRGAPAAVKQTGGGSLKLVIAGIGIGLGALLLLLALYTFWVAWRWNGVAQDGATVGYTLVGFFLTVAGLGGILATWNHNFRVLDPDRAPAPAHH